MRDIRVSHGNIFFKAFWQTLFRQKNHLKTLADTIKIIYLQVLNYYIKNAQ